jgi:hypothetical protein
MGHQRFSKPKQSAALMFSEYGLDLKLSFPFFHAILNRKIIKKV